MITFLVGENSFESERALRDITSRFDGSPEILDGSELQLAQLPDVLMGASLFNDARMVIIKNLSENKTIWPVFSDWIERISSDIHVVLVDAKPDKRTLTYKTIKQHADVKEFPAWGDRDTHIAESWVAGEARALEISIDKKCVQLLVRQIGNDQWQLFRALEKLALVDEVTAEVIDDVIDKNPVENVFNLFETALSGDAATLKRILKNLENTEDVFRLSALLSSQALQLAAIAVASDSDNPGKDFGIHPFVLSKLAKIAKRLKRTDVIKIVTIFAEADDDMKVSKADPWLLVERSLMKLANIK